MNPQKIQDDYQAFLASKILTAKPAGFEVTRRQLPGEMKPFQSDVTRWSLRAGRAALFLDTGLGKSLCELSWANQVVRHTGRPVILFTPLAVGPQMVREAEKFGIPGVRIAKEQGDVSGAGIWVTNYQRLHKFDSSEFAGVVLDEGGILKNFAGSTRKALTAAFADTPYRLIGTATPAPNDHEELGCHAEFLGVMSRVEMLATYFIHDSGNTSEWRLKGHAAREFWRWVASWAMMLRRPSDLGYEDEGYDLPPLNIIEHRVACEAQEWRLFAVPAETLSDKRAARRKTMQDRVAKTAELAQGDDPCVIWCELNDEADAATDAIDGAVQVAGSDDDEAKADRLTRFTTGGIAKLVTKATIAGFGMNWQHCHRTIVVGVSDSYEQFYQLVRRFWRYGQTMPVDVHVITSDLEVGSLDNVMRKQKAHDEQYEEILSHTRDVNRAALGRTVRMTDNYTTDVKRGENWTMMLGDVVERIREVDAESVGYSIFSPPFSSLYTYSNSPRDLGNCAGDEQFFKHFQFLVGELYRILMPGRLVSFHCMNLPTTKERDGFIGIRDFRGDLIRLFQDAGFIFHSEVCIWKDPVTAMQRTKAIGLLHKQIKKDSCVSRQGIADYLVSMKKPGDNPNPVSGRFEEYVGVDGPAVVNAALPNRGRNRLEEDRERFSIEVWQRYASPVWMDIDQSRTLNNYRDGREEQDERHICPLQLDVIARGLELWSNPGDLVFSPFAGIGSEGYESILRGRRFLGVELKKTYFDVAVKNLEAASGKVHERDLFSDIDEPEPVVV